MIGLTYFTAPFPIRVMPIARLGSNKYQLLCHWFDNVTESDIKSWCQLPDFSVEWGDKVTMNVHCHISRFVCCLLFYVLATSMASSGLGIDLGQCALMVTL